MIWGWGGETHVRHYFLHRNLKIRTFKNNVLLLLFCLFIFSMAAPTAYGVSQAQGQMRAVAAGLTPEPQQRGIQALSATYTTAHSNAESLTH